MAHVASLYSEAAFHSKQGYHSRAGVLPYITYMSGVSNPAMYSSGATNLVPEGQGGKTTDLELADHWPTCVNGWRSGAKDMFSRQPSVHHPNLVNGIGSV